MEVVFQSPFEILIYETKNLSTNVIIASVYFPPSTRIGEFKDVMVRLIDFLEPRQSRKAEYLHDQVYGSDNSSSSQLTLIPDTPDEIFLLEELLYILKGKTKESAAGIDGITYLMVKKLNSQSTKALLAAMNHHWRDCSIRDSWRSIRIVSIFIKNKDPDQFTGIALIPVFLKVINLMFKERFSKFIEENNILPSRSYAYRKHRSASTCINDILHTKITNYIGSIFLPITLDLLGDGISQTPKAAFGSSKQPLIIRILNIVLNLLPQSKNNTPAIDIIWTPAHIGLSFNELADKSAKLASIAGQEIQASLSFKDACGIVYNELWSQWNVEYKNIATLKDISFLQYFPNLPKTH
ncbi:hypothetical protein CVS40_6958 [Lucilia cuprina]|nr:hypothetical protein CVS40_6958 [Lucilia cuprina]